MLPRPILVLDPSPPLPDLVSLHPRESFLIFPPTTLIPTPYSSPLPSDLDSKGDWPRGGGSLLYGSSLEDGPSAPRHPGGEVQSRLRPPAEDASPDTVESALKTPRVWKHVTSSRPSPTAGGTTGRDDQVGVGRPTLPPPPPPPPPPPTPSTPTVPRLTDGRWGSLTQVPHWSKEVWGHRLAPGLCLCTP